MQPAQTHVSLELITDTDMYHFIENSILGGVSMITTRYARANAPTPPAYDASRPNVNLIYLDANNLYGWAMSQPLPTHGFRFLQHDEIEALAVEVGELSDDADDGYRFEVDLSYPQHLNDAHGDYPLAPSRWRLVVICIHPLSRQSFHRLHLKGNSLLISEIKSGMWYTTAI